jgi:hypothetical protein
MRCPRPVENLNRAWSLFCAQRGCKFTLTTLLQNSARPAASRGEASVVIASAHGLPACPAPQHGGPGQQSRPDDSALPFPVQIHVAARDACGAGVDKNTAMHGCGSLKTSAVHAARSAATGQQRASLVGEDLPVEPLSSASKSRPKSSPSSESKHIAREFRYGKKRLWEKW